MEKHWLCGSITYRTFVDFCPSISEELLLKSINFAKKYTSISDDEIKVILQSRKSFLFDKKQPWNKTTNPCFDVGMGSFDGAECCGIDSLYLLSCLKPLNLNIWLYRDDALGVLKMTPRQADLMKMKICKIFKANKLSITIEVNLKVVNFLDITLDLNSGVYKPYMKPNDNPIYIHTKSNHPPAMP